MDPFSITAGIAGLLSLTVQLTQILSDYTSSVKNAIAESHDLAVELGALVTVLQQLDRFLGGQAPTGRFQDSSIIYTTTKTCHGKLQSLVFVLQKFMDGTRERSKLWQRCVKWPFEKNQHQQTVQIIRHCVHIFHFSVSINGWKLVSDSADELKNIRLNQVDHSEEVTRIFGEVAATIHQGHTEQSKELAVIVAEVAALNSALENYSQSSHTKLDTVLENQLNAESNAKREKILSWICINTDPSAIHNNALSTREPETGLWFLESDVFQDWIKHSKFVWLYGIPGCGKTVLCSTIIEAVRIVCEQSTTHTMAYFYFNFQHVEKQGLYTLMQSLIRQVCGAETYIPDDIKKLHWRWENHNIMPTQEDLIIAFLSNVKEFKKQVYIVMDALDEFPESDGPLRRMELLLLIKRLVKEGPSNLHVLVTSRDEVDIRQVLGNLAPGGVPLLSRNVDPDIRALVASRLAHGRFAELPQELKTQIMEKVGNGAQGMFRWATCQLDMLSKCRKVKDIKRALLTLPKTLDNTYARILARIDEDYVEDALSIFRWLAFSKYPLTLRQLAEAAIVRPSEEALDTDDRLTDVSEVIDICSGLVTLTQESRNPDGPKDDNFVRFAHFSVQEYLLSDRAGPFFIQAGPSHAYIAGCCISYLLQFHVPLDNVWVPSLNDVPLLRYAAAQWHHHIQSAKSTNAIKYHRLCCKLFTHESDQAITNWLYWDSSLPRHLFSSASLDPLLYYSSFLGLINVTEWLLKNGADANERHTRPRGATFISTPLEAAIQGGSVEVVDLLLKWGADCKTSFQMLMPPYHLDLETQNRLRSMLLEKGANIISWNPVNVSHHW